jgi:hypothetical protein
MDGLTCDHSLIFLGPYKLMWATRPCQFGRAGPQSMLYTHAAFLHPVKMDTTCEAEQQRCTQTSCR